jgi:prepilin-type N-terminal cleavage/methylation domain-containing protein
MKRPFSVRLSAAHTGFTLIELLVSTALSLLLLGIVITMFGQVSESITQSRAMLEAADRLRLAEQRLHLDLSGVTAIMNPPGRPENSRGYFEIMEGPVGTATSGVPTTMTSPSDVAKNTDKSNAADDSVGDFDDILMFTVYSPDRPFIGRVPTTLDPSGTIQSHYAEVAWFVRGRTLHRRILLIVPGANLSAVTSPARFYADYDISARWDATTGKMVPNTLADLTRRECRFAHCPATFPSNVAAYWLWTAGGCTFATLPTLNECSYSGLTGLLPNNSATSPTTLDFWTNVASCRFEDNAFIGGGANQGTRPTDDIILTNVIGFDVKVFDPTAQTTSGTRGAYVDLGYNSSLTGTNATKFSSLGDSKSSLMASDNKHPRVYDTYSITHFDPQGANGVDDNGNGIVDDDDEKSPGLTNRLPPYWHPLRGIQVKIRIFEPDSKQIREVTVEQDFLPQ